MLALGRAEEMHVVGQSGTAAEALHFLKEETADVVVVEISLEDVDGLSLIRELRSQFPDVRALVYSMYDEETYAERAIRAGALGYVMKTEPPTEVVNAIREVRRGEVYFSPHLVSQILGSVIQRGGPMLESPVERLTDREFTVFKMLGKGDGVRDIAEELNLNRKTIEKYRRRAREKLGYDTNDELLRHAVQWVDRHQQARVGERKADQ